MTNRLGIFKFTGIVAMAVLSTSFFMHRVPAQVQAQALNSWQWRSLTPNSNIVPDSRRDGEMIHDPIGNRLILFGGNSDNGPLNDAWAFDLGSRIWTRLSTKGNAPAPRFGFDAVYDPVGYRMIVYSGQGAGFFNDTWALNLATLEWSDLSPVSESSRPKRRYGSGAVFDSQSRSLVSFAGFTSEAGRFQDVQSFSLSNNVWADWTPAGTKPQVRCLLTAALDRAGRRMIIYGGQRNGPLDDLWAFDLATRQWTNLTPSVRPAGRMWASSFVNKDGRFMVFGGLGNGNYNETWEFDFTRQQWTLLSVASPPAARNAAMTAYSESEERFFVFGGTGNDGNLNDLWELSRSGPPASTLTSVSAARFGDAIVAPESIVAAFGSNLAVASQSAGSAALPTSIAGTSVRIRDVLGVDRLAPLFFVSPTQVNYLVPAATAAGAATVTLTAGDGSTSTGVVQIANVAPGVFSANASGQGAAAAVALRVESNGGQRIDPVAVWSAEQNRFVLAPLDLSAPGEQVYLILFGTGIRYRGALSAVSAQIGGTNAPVLYAEAQGDFIGLDQINLLLPKTLAGRGEVDVVLQVEGRMANTVRVAFK